MHGLPAFLVQGYREFMRGDFRVEAEHYRQLATEGQRPTAMVIACCDSRSAPELIFHRGVGELFVLRNVANLVPPYEPDANLHGTSAAIEFAVRALEVSDVLVLGHAGCGGIHAALNPDGALVRSSAFIGNWMRVLSSVASALPAEVPSGNRNLELERLAVCQSLINLRTFPFVREREEAGKLRLHGSWFDVATGGLWIKARDSNEFQQLSA